MYSNENYNDITKHIAKTVIHMIFDTKHGSVPGIVVSQSFLLLEIGTRDIFNFLPNFQFQIFFL
jgi:hypothetical protein